VESNLKITKSNGDLKIEKYISNPKIKGEDKKTLEVRVERRNNPYREVSNSVP